MRFLSSCISGMRIPQSARVWSCTNLSLLLTVMISPLLQANLSYIGPAIFRLFQLLMHLPLSPLLTPTTCTQTNTRVHTKQTNMHTQIHQKIYSRCRSCSKSKLRQHCMGSSHRISAPHNVGRRRGHVACAQRGRSFFSSVLHSSHSAGEFHAAQSVLGYYHYRVQ